MMMVIRIWQTMRWWKQHTDRLGMKVAPQMFIKNGAISITIRVWALVTGP